MVTQERTYNAIEKKVDRVFSELDKLSGLELTSTQVATLQPVLTSIMYSAHGILDVIGRSRI